MPLIVLLCLLCAARASGADYSYESGAANGPENWATIGAGSYARCRDGSLQSPIDISDAALPTGSPDATLRPVDIAGSANSIQRLRLVNDGARVAVDFTQDALRSSTLMDPSSSTGFVYAMTSLEIHTPSEHTVGQAHEDVEVQLVYTISPSDQRRAPATTPRALVVSVFARASPLGHNEALETVLSRLPAKPSGSSAPNTVDFTASAPAEFFNPASLSPASPDYVTYLGSQTAPPCTQLYQYFVMLQPVSISSAQLAAVEAAVGATWGLSGERKGNSRPTQLFLSAARWYRAIGDPDAMQPPSTGTGVSGTAEAYSIVALLLSVLGSVLFALAVVGVVKLSSRTADAVTEAGSTVTTAAVTKKTQ